MTRNNVPEVFPVAWTSINWQAYLKLARDLTGEMISEKFDAARMTPGLAAFLVSLGQLVEAPGDARQIIEQSGGRLRHFSVSFLAVMHSETLYAFMEEVDLVITSCDSNRSAVKVVLISGNGEQWRDAIVNCSVERVNMDVRVLANKCQSYFEQQGLERIWASYTKTRLHDQTLVLGTK